MDDQYWDTILTGLDEHQLHQLRQKIDQLLTQYSFQRDSEGKLVFVKYCMA